MSEQHITNLQKVFRLGRSEQDKKKQKDHIDNYLEKHAGIAKNQESVCIAVKNTIISESEEPYSKLIAIRFLTQCVKKYGNQHSLHDNIKKHMTEVIFNYATLLSGDNDPNTFGANLFLDYQGQDASLPQIQRTFACFLCYDILTLWKDTYKNNQDYQYDYDDLYNNIQACDVNIELGVQIKGKSKQKAPQQGGIMQSQAGVLQSQIPQQQQKQQQKQQNPQTNQSQTPGNADMTKSQRTGQLNTMLEKLAQVKEMVEMIIQPDIDDETKDEFFEMCKVDINEVFEYLIEIEDDADEDLIEKQGFAMDAQELFSQYENKKMDKQFINGWLQLTGQTGQTPQPGNDQQQQQQQQKPTQQELEQQRQIEEQRQQELQRQQQQQAEQKRKEEEQEKQRQIQLQKQRELEQQQEQEKQRQIQLQKQKEEEEKQRQIQLQKQKEQEEQQRQLQLQKEQEEKLKQEQQEKELQQQREREMENQRILEQQKLQQQQEEEKRKMVEQKLQQQKEEEERQRKIQELQEKNQKKVDTKKAEVSFLKRIGGAKALQIAADKVEQQKKEQEQQQNQNDFSREHSIPDDDETHAQLINQQENQHHSKQESRQEQNMIIQEQPIYNQGSFQQQEVDNPYQVQQQIKIQETPSQTQPQIPQQGQSDDEEKQEHFNTNSDEEEQKQQSNIEQQKYQSNRQLKPQYQQHKPIPNEQPLGQQSGTIDEKTVPQNHKYLLQQYQNSQQKLEREDEYDEEQYPSQRPSKRNSQDQQQLYPQQQQLQQQQQFLNPNHTPSMQNSQLSSSRNQEIFQSNRGVDTKNNQQQGLLKSNQKMGNSKLGHSRYVAGSQYSVSRNKSQDKGFAKNTYSEQLAQKLDNNSLNHRKAQPSDFQNRPLSKETVFSNNAQDFKKPLLSSTSFVKQPQQHQFQSQQYSSNIQSQPRHQLLQSSVQYQAPLVKSENKLAEQNQKLQLTQQEYQRKVERLEQQVNSIEKENYILQQKQKDLQKSNQMINSQSIPKETVQKQNMEFTDNFLKLQQDFELQKEELEKYKAQKQELIEIQQKNQAKIEEVQSKFNLEKTKLKKKDQEFQKQYDKQADEIQKLKEQLKKQSDNNLDIQQKQHEINEIKTKNQKLSKQKEQEIEQKVEEIHKLRQQNQEIQEQMDRLQQMQNEQGNKQEGIDPVVLEEHQNLLKQKENQIQALQQGHQQEIDLHQNKITDLEKEIQQIADNYQTQIQNLEQQNQIILSQAGNQTEEERRIQQEKLEQMQKEMQEQQEMIKNNLNKNQEERQKQVEQLEAKLKQLEQEKLDQQKKIDELQQNYDNQGDELFGKDKEIYQTFQELQEYQQKHHNLTIELDQARKEIDQQKQILESHGNKNEEVLLQLQDQNRLLNQSVNQNQQKIEELEQTLQDNEKRKQEIEKEYQNLKQENLQIQLHLEQQREEHERSLQDNQKILDQTVIEKINLEQQLLNFKENDDSQAKILKDTIYKQEQQLQSLQVQLESFTSQNNTQNNYQSQQPNQISLNQSPKTKPQIFEEFKSQGKINQETQELINRSSYRSPQKSANKPPIDSQQNSDRQLIEQIKSPNNMNSQQADKQDKSQPQTQQIKLSELINMQQTQGLQSNRNEDILGPNTTNNNYPFINNQYPQNDGGIQNINHKKTLSSMKKIDPNAADLIYPFNNPLKYYENKPQKDVKGTLKSFYYEYFREQLPRDVKGIHRFKRACMNKNEYLTLFQNENLQLLCMTNYAKEQEFFLTVNFIFKNIGKQLINNFKATYVGNAESVQIFSNPSILMNQIQPSTQLTQDLQINFQEVPYHFILLELEFKINGLLKKFTIALPHSVNQYLEVQQLTPQDFKKSWKESNNNVIRSEEYPLENNLVGSAYDFLRLFPSFFEVNENKAKDYTLGISENRVGGYMYLRHTNTALLIKIIVQPNNNVVFQMSFMNQENHDLHQKTLEFILNTFVLLYTKANVQLSSRRIV